MLCSRYVSILLVVAFCCLPVRLKAQPFTGKHGYEAQKQIALAALQQHTRPDTARVHALLQLLSTATFLKERKELMPYQREAMTLSRQLQYSYGMAQSYGYAAAYYKSASDYGNALRYYDSALLLLRNPNDSLQIALKATIYERKGSIYQVQENFYPALNCFFEALKYLTGKDHYRAARLQLFITEIYLELNNVEKAAEFSNNNLHLLVLHATVKKLAASLYFAAINVELKRNDLSTAASYVDSLEPLINEPHETLIRFGYYMKKGHIHFRQQQYHEAHTNYQMAYQVASAMGHHAVSINTSLQWLAATALKLGNYTTARAYAEEHLVLAIRSRSKTSRVEALTNLANYHQATGNSTTAFNTLSQVMQLKDSIAAETNLSQVNLLGAAYQKEMQDKEIGRLQNAQVMQDIKMNQQTMMNRFFMAFILVLLGIGYLGYRNFKTRSQLAHSQQEIQKQKIIELEKTRQLLSIDAMIKGQEEERSRIAKDLHDGLGGLLSGTKLSFMNVKEKLVLSPEHTQLFNRSLTMLDNTIGDLRKVAHNLMPATLVKYGLYDALRDFCDSIHAATGIEMIYQSYGIQRKLNSTAAVFVYRIIQELVNNAIKHAHASAIIVQLTTAEQLIRITVEDNGKGFDKALLEQNKGNGLVNISYRVQYLHGQYEIITAPGEGTSINITLTA